MTADWSRALATFCDAWCVTIPAGSKRIFVTGNAGAGKTTFGRALADSLNLPFHSLDGVVWQQGWRKTPQHEKFEKIEHLISADAWVIDGVSDQVMQAADVVVFLDVPRRVSALRVMRRNLPYLFKSRPGLPPKCPEILVVPKLVRLIWRFPRNVKPAIMNELTSRREGTFVHVPWPADCTLVLEDKRR